MAMKMTAEEKRARKVVRYLVRSGQVAADLREVQMTFKDALRLHQQGFLQFEHTMGLNHVKAGRKCSSYEAQLRAPIEFQERAERLRGYTLHDLQGFADMYTNLPANNESRLVFEFVVAEKMG